MDEALFWHNNGSNIRSSLCHNADPGPLFNSADFSIIGSGAGAISVSAMEAFHATADHPNPSYTMYIYTLEGASEYSLERWNYTWNGSTQTLEYDTQICSGYGNGPYQLANPLDICGDNTDRIYVLDKLTTGQPVVKVYNSDGTYVGSFGDSTNISGTPYRMDIDFGDGDIYVAHSDGISMFTQAEVPY